MSATHEITIDLDSDKSMDEQLEEQKEVIEQFVDEAVKTVEDAIESDHDLLQAIREQERLVAAAESEWEEAKEEAKAAKSKFDCAVSALRRAIRQQQEKLPLFDKPAEEASDEVDDDDTDDTDWRDVPLSELAIPDGLLGKLYDAKIETMGQLADRSAKEPLNFLPGIGDASMAKIEAATTQFWAERRTQE